MKTECEMNCATFEIIEGQKVAVRVADGKVAHEYMPRLAASRVWTCNCCGKLASAYERTIVEAAYARDGREAKHDPREASATENLVQLKALAWSQRAKHLTAKDDADSEEDIIRACARWGETEVFIAKLIELGV